MGLHAHCVGLVVASPGIQVGLSKQRWDDYRSLFKKIGLDAGIERSGQLDEKIYFIVNSRGMSYAGWQSGFVWSPIENLVSQHTDSRPVAYKLLKPNWYLYESHR
jgi:hypothetical protein